MFLFSFSCSNGVGNGIIESEAQLMPSFIKDIWIKFGRIVPQFSLTVRDYSLKLWISQLLFL
jgi:hypothetical protein